jgi:hypothetical protein
MIVRISGEGQYRLTNDLLDQVNALDNRLVEIVAQNDDQAFKDVFGKLLALIRQGEPLPPEALAPSDIIVPPADLSLAEAKELFVGEGLVPG